MTNYAQNRLLRWLPSRFFVVAFFVIVAFCYGVGVELYQWVPFATLQSIKQGVHQLLSTPTAGYQGEQELLQYAFTDPVSESSLYYSPITNLVGVREANERVFVSREGFEKAYQEIGILTAEQLDRAETELPVVRIQFKYQGKTYEAFSYGTLPQECTSARGSLIIPGSGLNQSYAIATDDKSNYHHGILQALESEGGQIFTFIKPNEDYLAWHDGKGQKLNLNFIVQWHLNLNGSYSVSYLVEAMAFMKWMRSCFKENLIAGLSSGGAAALIVNLQSESDFAIISAGYSILNRDAKWSSITGMMGVPGFGELDNPFIIKKELAGSLSQWIFSWGLKENGTYKIEAEERLSAKVFEELPNVQVVIHNDGHVFPVQYIQEWLERR